MGFGLILNLPFLLFRFQRILYNYAISSNDNVLDVACGTGNSAITAKRLKRGAKVTGVDFTPELLAQAKVEASMAEAEDIEWNEGNVEDLPFENETFDVVLSSFGHILLHIQK
jgi:ubiquinone/menaquinone biosynthesis C-methylase UbiE